MAAVRAGMGYRAAGAIVGVTGPSVLRWCLAADAAAREAPAGAAPPPAPAPPSAPVDVAPPPPRNALEATQRQMARLDALADSASAAGHHEAAVSATRNSALLAPVLARLEKGREDDRDHVRYSRAEIAEALAGLRARVASLLDRPLLCADCGRKLSVAWSATPHTIEDQGDPK